MAVAVSLGQPVDAVARLFHDDPRGFATLLTLAHERTRAGRR